MIKEDQSRAFPWSVIINVAGTEFETRPIRDVGQVNTINAAVTKELSNLDAEQVNWIAGAPNLSELEEDGIVMITIRKRQGVLCGGWCGAL